MPIAFDTRQLVRQPDADAWDDPTTGDRVVVQYTPGVPGIPAPLSDLPTLRRLLAEASAANGCLVEADVVEFGGLPALLRFEKVPHWNRPDGVIYTASIIVPRATGVAAVLALCAENGVSGSRETAVALSLFRSGGQTRAAMDALHPPHPYAPDIRSALPYTVSDEARWDPEFPDHAMTRARNWYRHLASTAQVDPRFAALPEFTGPVPEFPGMKQL